MVTEQQLSVLVVDDNEDDLEFIKLALEQVDGLQFDITVARDGEEALRCARELYEQGRPAKFAVVDLKMPRVDGRGFLRAVRQDEDLAALPVLMLSTSRAHDDVQSCYRDGCNAYFVKPLEFTPLTELIAEMTKHWSRCVVLPAAAV